ncbi:MAG: GAF domain-containing protein [Bdellovibrionota bacterium]
MRLSVASFALLLSLLAIPAFASTVAEVHCRENGTKEALCQIQLAGEVQEGERLYLTSVAESDQLFWGNIRLGGTGMFFDQSFFAGFLPRLYSLQPLHGQVSPLLTIKAHSIFSATAGISASTKVRVVDSNYPITKVLAPLYWPVGTFLFLALAWFYLVTWLQHQTIDGWIYPRAELRWFFGSLAGYLLLSHDVSRVFVPLTWSVDLHLFSERLMLLVCAWSHSSLVLAGRFSDRSCVERGLSREESPRLARLFAGTFLVSLAALALASQLRYGYFYFLLAFQSVLMAYNTFLAVAGTEWRRILKRSGTSPIIFHFSLLFFPVALLTFSAGRFFFLLDGQRFLDISSGLVLAAGVWRLHRFQYVRRRSLFLVAECREILQAHVHGEGRLAALCAFFESEWGAARVSVISVENSQGLVLASAGPDAITAENRAEPRKLGPFLRRVCKEGHILYAPVAEELGKDLQEKGMRHSSLALPLTQEGCVRVVLCIMADEGERIHPLDATLMELVTENLGLEILSAVGQHIAEEKNERLMAISRNSGGLAVEHMDGWGHLHFSKSEEERYLVGAECSADPKFIRQLQRSPTLSKLLKSFELELRSIWTGLAESCEFLPKDVNGDFWVLSPREFRQPFLQTLGGERCGLLLAHALERAARNLAAKPGYLPLGICAPKLIVGGTRLRFVSYGTAETGNVETDAADFSLLQRLRENAEFGTLLYFGDNPAARLSDERFTCRTQATRTLEVERLYSVIGVHCDKKEFRKLEARALEQARLYLKRAA